jgi:DTW domain-containing protein YfiP
MDVATYHRRRREAYAAQPVFRRICGTCRQPDFSCFCAWLKPFDPGIKFVILSHPIEAFRRIATGRMSHLSLRDSQLIVGQDYTFNPELNALLEDTSLHCVMLYPGRLSRNLSTMCPLQRSELVPKNKRLAVLVIDGTWNTARKMVNVSRNMQPLPRICFTPPGPSNFRVRRQPRAECYSTIEAIHHTVELLGTAAGFDVNARAHDALLDVFDNMVNRQIELAHTVRV